MKKRHCVLTLLGLLSVITYLDRVCISVAGPRMQSELDLSPERWGWVLSVFILAYGIFEIPSGALGDRLGQRKVLMRIVLWWSIFTGLTGLARSYGTLLGTRFLFGAGEAGAYPNLSGSIGRWFPSSERARTQGIVWAASRIGGALSPWMVVPLMTRFGWRATFLIFGALGVGWTVVWLAWYHDEPAAQPGIEPEELSVIGRRDATSVGAVSWRRLFGSVRLWMIMAMFFCYVWGSMFYLTWFPTYLVKGRGLSENEMGLFAALPFLCGAVGNVCGGYLCDRLSLRFGLAKGRRLVGATSLFVSALLLGAVALTTGKVVGVVLLAIGFGVMDCMLPVAWALCVDVGGAHAGAVAGAMNTAGQAGGFVCTVMFGYLVTAFGSYDLPIFVIAAMVMIGAVLFWRIDATRSLFELEDDSVSPLPCV